MAPRSPRKGTSLLCGKCNALVNTKAPDTLQCNENSECCAKYYHLVCADITQIDFQVLQKSNRKYACKTCRNKLKDVENANHLRLTPSTHKHSDKKTNLTLEDVMVFLQDMRSEMRDLKKDLMFYSESFEEQKIRNALYEEEINKLKKENETIKNEIRKINNTLETSETEKRKSNLLIVGINYKIEDNNLWIKELKQNAEKAIKYVNPTIEPGQYEIKLTNTKKPNSPILLEFSTPSLKNSFMEERKTKGKINASVCGISNETTPIYFNEDMTKDQKNLYSKARNLKKEGFQFVWAKNGNIFVREKADSVIQRIKSEEDINKLKKY